MTPTDISGHQVPCVAPCPKCGSGDVNRQYRARNATWPCGDERDGYYSKFAASYSPYKLTANREHIEHHCRTCQYDWQTPPLPKPKPARKWKPCKACANTAVCEANAMVRNSTTCCGGEA